MPISQTLQLKILETKKRLFKTPLNESALLSLSLCLVLGIITYSSRLITIGGRWGLTLIEIPVVSAPFKDLQRHNFTESASSTLGQSSLVVTLTPTEFIFGDVNSFTTQLEDIRNKFIVSHINGSPQISRLVSQIDEWKDDRLKRLGIKSDGIVIFIPDAKIPIPIITAVIAKMKTHESLGRIVLGGDLL
jgi:hypothetical protein